jgi:outer membrane receptor protein involved in Fe transport
VFQVAPSLVMGDLEGGVNLVYNGEAWGDDANKLKLPAYTTVNLFLNYAVNDRTQVSLSVNNLTDAIGYTEVEGDGHAARSINGRTAKVSLKYSF